MKMRNGFVSNSSSCSFTCFLTGETKCGWDYYDNPIENNIYRCSKCGTVYFPSSLQEFNINVYPDRKGWIKEKNCPACNGWKVERVVLKPRETYKVVKEDE